MRRVEQFLRDVHTVTETRPDLSETVTLAQMSAKLHLTRNTKPTTLELPPEIWALVFDWTTRVPGAYDPDYLPLSFTQPLSKEQNQERTKSRRSRSSLVRVCKSWSVLALKPLFEHIIIAKDADIPSLHKALLRSRISDRTHLGYYTKRLDISLRTGDINKAMRDVGDIIRWFPNLTFFTISLGTVSHPDPDSEGRSHSGRDGSPILDALCSTCASLEVIQVLSHSSFYISLPRVFASFPNLRSFRNEGLLGPAIHTPCFHLAASLTTIAFDDGGGHWRGLPPQLDAFPSLHTVMFYTESRAHQGFLSFIEIHGSTLTSVMIRSAKNSAPHVFFNKVLDTIRTSCPGVANFMIWFDSWYWTHGGPAVLPRSVRVLGVRCKELQTESWRYEAFFSWVDPLDGRVLRLLDERHVTDLCRKHALAFKTLRRRLEPGGWQFQGPDERVLP